MSGGGLTVEISWMGANGFTTIRRTLATFGQRVDNMAPAWTDVGEALLQDFAKNFETEGGTFGAWSKWAPLALATQRDRARRGYDPTHPILQRTGALYQSVVWRGGPQNVFLVGPNSLEIGSSLAYAGYHNQGTSRMPRRAIVALSAQRQSGGSQSVVGILVGYLMEQLKAANLTARGFDEVGEGY